MKHKLYSHKWFKIHTIAKTNTSTGLIAVVDNDEAAIVGFDFDLSFGTSIAKTKMPTPEQIFNIPEHQDTFDINWKDYANHPDVINFQPHTDWIWEGTPEELYYAAKNNTDLMFPNRKLSTEDSDYALLSELYAQIRKYLEKKMKKKKPKKINHTDFSSVFEDCENTKDENC